MAFSTGNPEIDKIVAASMGSGNLDLNSGAYPGGTSTVNPGPRIPGAIAGTPPIEQVFIQPDPTSKIKVKVPGQPDLPETDIWDPNYIAQLKQQAHLKDQQLYNGQNSAAIDAQYSQYAPDQNQQDIYSKYKTITESGRTAKNGIENFLTQFLQVPPDQVGNKILGIPDVLGLKKLALSNSASQNFSPAAYSYESSKNAYAPQLKDALGAQGLRLNVPEIGNMANLLPSVANDPQTNKINVLNLNNLLVKNYGVSLDAGIMQKYGITKEDVINRAMGKEATVSSDKSQQSDQTVTTTPPTGGTGGLPPKLSSPAASSGTQQQISAYQADSQKLTQAAQAEPDPQKKSNLLAQARILSSMSQDANNSPKTSPIMDTLAKVQDFLHKSQVLPAAGAIIGQAVIPIPGAGAAAGAFEGKKLSNMLNPDAAQAFLPNRANDNAAVKSALNYGIADLLFFGAGKLLKPIEAVTGLRGAAAEKATMEGGNVIHGDDIVSGVKNWADSVPASMTKAAQKFAKDVESKYGGQILSVNEGLAEKAASWGRGYTTAGLAGKPVAAEGERAVAGLIKDQLPQTIKSYDQVLHYLFAAQNVTKKIIPNVVGGGLKLLGLGETGKIIGGMMSK